MLLLLQNRYILLLWISKETCISPWSQSELSVLGLYYAHNVTLIVESFWGAEAPVSEKEGWKTLLRFPCSLLNLSFPLIKGWFTPRFGTRCRGAKAVEDLNIQLTHSISIPGVSCRAGSSFFTSTGKACPNYLSDKEQDVRIWYTSPCGTERLVESRSVKPVVMLASAAWSWSRWEFLGATGV